MRQFTTFALAAATAVSADRAMSGWNINCRVDTGGDGTYGPAFMSKNRDFNNELDFFWSSFGRGSAGIYGNGPFGVPGDLDGCSSVRSNSTSETLVENDWITWPNEVGQVPRTVFGTGYIHIPTGFATPATFDGCIAIGNMNSNNRPLTDDDLMIITGGCGTGSVVNTKYFYHVAKWFDMDQDGDLDLLTAAASGRLNPTDLSGSELVWFENPGDKKFKGGYSADNAWVAHKIAAGRDVADTSLDVFLNGGNIVVVTGGFASRTLAIVQGPVAQWKKRNGGTVSNTTIDTDGYYFNQEFHDLDRDGILDVLVTIGSYGEKEGQLVVYKGGNNARGQYQLSKKTVVYNQFPVFNTAAVGSPGDARAFYYGIRDENNGKIPNILVSGDDDGNFYMFTPSGSNDASEWKWGQYDFNQIYQSSAFNPFITPFTAPTVGEAAVVDMNEDGCNEIVIPNYHNKQVVIIEQNALSACKILPPQPPTLPPLPTKPTFPTHRPNLA